MLYNLPLPLEVQWWTVRSKASKAAPGTVATDGPRWERMVTGLVCIWSVDSETGVHKRQMGADGGGRGGKVVERWVKWEKEVSKGAMSSQGSHGLKKTFLRFSVSQTHSVSLPTPNCGNSTASLWSHVFIWGMLCQVSGHSSYQGD